MRSRYHYGNSTYDVRIEREGETYRATIDGQTFDLAVLDAQPGVLTLRPGSDGDHVRPEVIYWGVDGDTVWLSTGGCTYRLDPPPTKRRGAGGTNAEAATELRAPMPAQVRAVQVSEGDEIAAGQTLILLEAMKMEIRMQAPQQARVLRLLAKEGDTVERDQVVVELTGPGKDATTVQRLTGALPPDVEEQDDRAYLDRKHGGD